MDNAQAGIDWLREKRAELIQRLDAIHGDASRQRSADSGERAVEQENDQTLEEIELQTREELAQIDQALRRVEAGTYGTCEVCGEPIAADRLAAIPQSTTCIDCAATRQPGP